MITQHKSPLFHIVEGENAILQNGGTYLQVEIYARKDELYAKRGSGYIRLKSNNQTSHPKTSWEVITCEYAVAKHGRLILAQGTK